MTAQNITPADFAALQAQVASLAQSVAALVPVVTGLVTPPTQAAQFSTPTVVAQATAPVAKKVHTLVQYVNQDGKAGECTEAQFAVRLASAARMGRTLTVTGRTTGTLAAAPRKERITVAQDTKPCAVQGCTKKTLSTLCKAHRAAQA